jgi:hypothetical protein
MQEKEVKIKITNLSCMVMICICDLLSFDIIILNSKRCPLTSLKRISIFSCPSSL